MRLSESFPFGLLDFGLLRERMLIVKYLVEF